MANSNSATSRYQKALNYEDFEKQSLEGIEEDSQQGKDILSALNSYNYKEQEIANTYKNQELAAAKAYDLSQKYMAAQNEANGLSGLGISNTSSLRASSQYQNALADAYATREQASLDNYLAAQERIDTTRGEWASIKEAEKQDIMDGALTATSFEAAKSYLIANGIESGTAEYNKALSNWALQNGYSVSGDTVESGIQASIDARKTLENYGLSLGEDGSISNKSFNPKTVKGKDISDYYDWNNYFWDQSNSLDDLLGKSKNWTSANNGTYVDFNDGAGEKIFVFYDGLWYETNLTKRSLEASGKTVKHVDEY